MTESENGFGKQLLYEPVTRPDGKAIILWIEKGELRVDSSSPPYECRISAWYSRKEVELLGNGIFLEGALRIGYAHYNALGEELEWGRDRLFNKEIDILNGSLVQSFLSTCIWTTRELAISYYIWDN